MEFGQTKKGQRKISTFLWYWASGIFILGSEVWAFTAIQKELFTRI